MSNLRKLLRDKKILTGLNNCFLR